MAVTKKRRLSREDWLDLALSALSIDGADALRLDAICKRAGLTKGSFYHHFDDHAVFLKAVVAQWRHLQTDMLIAASEKFVDPEDIADALLDRALELDFRMELGIRELARRAPEIAADVAEVDEVRTDFVAKIYAARFGLPVAEVRDAAFLEYAAFAGIMLLAPDMTADRQRDLALRYDEMVTKAYSGEVPT